MTDVASGRAKGTIVVAVVLCVLSLGTPWYRLVGSDERLLVASGYRLESRLFLSVAIACLVVALNKRSTEPRLAARAINIAIVVLVIMLGLGLRRVAQNFGVLSMTPTALVLTVGTIVLLLSVRFRADSA